MKKKKLRKKFGSKAQDKIGYKIGNILGNKQVTSVILMCCLSGGVIAVAEVYKGKSVRESIAEVVAQPVDYRMLATSSDAPAISLLAKTMTIPETEPVTEAIEEEGFVPHVVQLNLAYLYPEGADENEPLQSRAGNIFKVMMRKDEEWMSTLYDLSDISPERMASRVGRSRNSILGKYNASDENHDPNDPDTWTIDSFKKVHMQFVDGDGAVSSGFSNVVAIMSMASVYTWFDDMEDEAAFLNYALNLWDRSHSYSVSIGDVYYCDGCLGGHGSEREREELLAEDALERAASVASAMSSFTLPGSDAESGAADNSPAAGSAAADTTAAAANEGTGAGSAAESSLAAESAAAESSPVESAASESTSEEHAAAEHAAAENTDAVEGGESAMVEAGSESLQSPDKSLGPGVAVASASNATEAETTAETEAARAKSQETITCPGHVDLYIKAKIVGVEEKNNLFILDSVGNNQDNIKEDGWEGWNTYTKSYATRLSKQDWYERYGLSVSSLSARNPLSESEIEEIMNELPMTLSKEKRSMIKFALSSVGKVPYYWGGKPAAASYTGNQFGTIVKADEKGRILRGLDCSGWINWVYWSTTGSRLPYESTSGLAVCGTRIRRSELEPGDIIIRTGANAHVVMFLGWEADGQIRCVHETSGSVNNVTVAVRDANWPYYVRLMD